MRAVQIRKGDWLGAGLFLYWVKFVNVSENDRNRIISRASATGISINLLLAGFKALAGAFSGSVAIVTDALNNLSDAVSAVVTLAGAKYAKRKPDRNHPFGHGRAEYVSSAAIAVIILYTAVSAFIESVSKIIRPEETHYDLLAAVVMITAVAVKIVLARYYRICGVKADSQALRASSIDALFDAVLSGSILAGAALTGTTGINLDGWIGAGIAVFIFRSGLSILKEGLSSIIGERAPADLTQHLKDQILQFPGVMGVEDLELHVYGPERMAGAVHIALPEDMPVGEADTICRQITADLLQDHGIEMTVGIYAENVHSRLADAMQCTLEKVVADEECVLQVHGFYLDQETRRADYHLIMQFGCPDPEEVMGRIRHVMEDTYKCFEFQGTADRDITD